jgi:hypothetical protein
MSIRIDQDIFSSTSHDSVHVSEAAGRCLPVALTLQAPYSFWCWAAVADSISSFYHDFGPPGKSRICRIAAKVLGISPNKCLACQAGNSSCDKMMPLAEALGKNLASPPINGIPPFSKFRSEIEALRPVAVRRRSPKHFRTVVGYVAAAGGSAQQLVVADPMGTLAREKYLLSFKPTHDRTFLTKPRPDMVVREAVIYNCPVEKFFAIGSGLAYSHGLSASDLSADLQSFEFLQPDEVADELINLEIGLDGLNISRGVPVVQIPWAEVRNISDLDFGGNQRRYLIAWQNRVHYFADVDDSQDSQKQVARFGVGTDASRLLKALVTLREAWSDIGPGDVYLLEVDGLQMSALVVIRESDSANGFVNIAIPVGPDFRGMDPGKIYLFASFWGQVLDLAEAVERKCCGV